MRNNNTVDSNIIMSDAHLNAACTQFSL